MSLDVVVFCDCVEKGRLKSPHPFPRLLCIAPNGSPEIRSEDSAEIEQHDNWMHSACKHEDMMIEGDFLGNAGAIGFLRQGLRQAVSAPARDFPVLWKKVIYDGTHCGDHLTLSSVRHLDQELKQFRKINFASLRLQTADVRFIDEFGAKLKRIVKMAIKIKKPIAF